MSAARHWTPHEDAVIRLTPAASPGEIAAKLPGRSPESVVMRRLRLGLTPPRPRREEPEVATAQEAAVPAMDVTPAELKRHETALLDALGGFGLDQVAAAWRRSNGASERVCVRALAAEGRHPRSAGFEEGGQ